MIMFFTIGFKKGEWMQKIFQEVIQECFDKGYTSEEIINHIMSIGNEMINDEVDISELLKEIAQPFIDLKKVYDPSNSDELDNALENLYTNHDIKFDEDERMLENTFKYLSQYDKLIIKDGKAIPFILDLLINSLLEYASIYVIWEKTKKENGLKRTIAHTSSTICSKMLSPLHPYLKENAFMNETQTKTLKNIYDAFNNDPYEMNFVFWQLRFLKPENLKVIDREKFDVVYKSTEFLNSAGQVHKKDITNSLIIQITQLYLKDSMFQKALNLKKHISKENLAIHIDVILRYVFHVNSNAKSNKFGQPIQIRTNYEGVPLFEYIRKGQEKKHPVLNDKEFMNKFSEKIKGKLPPKHSGKTSK